MRKWITKALVVIVAASIMITGSYGLTKFAVTAASDPDINMDQLDVTSNAPDISPADNGIDTADGKQIDAVDEIAKLEPDVIEEIPSGSWSYSSGYSGGGSHSGGGNHSGSSGGGSGSGGSSGGGSSSGGGNTGGWQYDPDTDTYTIEISDEPGFYRNWCSICQQYYDGPCPYHN